MELVLDVKRDFVQINMEEIIKIMVLTVLQNASFTLVSRARNSTSISYNAIASILSNGIWLLVLKNIITNFDKPSLMIAYVAGSVIGSTWMHYIVMKYFEKR